MLLTGCSESDWEYLFMGFMAWGEEHNIIDDNGFHPSALAAVVASDTVDDWTNAPEAVQLDGLDVIRKIEMANDLSAQALKELDPEKMEQAINLRPDDWTLYETDAILWAAKENGVAASEMLFEADTRLKESLQYGDNCVEARRAQLHRRLALIWDEIKKQENEGREVNDTSELQYMYDFSAQELNEIDSSGWTEFCKSFSD
jgi:hypothetical protein